MFLRKPFNGYKIMSYFLYKDGVLFKEMGQDWELVKQETKNISYEFSGERLVLEQDDEDSNINILMVFLDGKLIYTFDYRRHIKNLCYDVSKDTFIGILSFKESPFVEEYVMKYMKYIIYIIYILFFIFIILIYNNK